MNLDLLFTRLTLSDAEGGEYLVLDRPDGSLQMSLEIGRHRCCTVYFALHRREHGVECSYVSGVVVPADFPLFIECPRFFLCRLRISSHHTFTAYVICNLLTQRLHRVAAHDALHRCGAHKCRRVHGNCLALEQLLIGASSTFLLGFTS